MTFYDVHYEDGTKERVCFTPTAPFFQPSQPLPLHKELIELARRRTNRTDCVKITKPFQGDAVEWERPWYDKYPEAK